MIEHDRKIIYAPSRLYKMAMALLEVKASGRIRYSRDRQNFKHSQQAA
jgi:hypothetical protein